MLVLLQLPIKGLLDQQILLSVILFVAAYLVGGVLRLYAANDVDKRSSEYRLRAWRKKRRTRIETGCTSNFEKHKAELAIGGDVSDILDKFDAQLFDEWLWYTDKFPYHAWLNRMWTTQGFCGVMKFFRKHYGPIMWSGDRWSSRSFFNYCKLIIIGSGGALVDEVNMAEGITRFFAGTVVALGISTWLLVASLVVQLLLTVTVTFTPQWNITLAVQGTFQGFYLALTLVLILALQWICHQILKRFRNVRFKEVETVYHTFYLYSVSHPDGIVKMDKVVSQKALAQKDDR